MYTLTKIGGSEEQHSLGVKVSHGRSTKAIDLAHEKMVAEPRLGSCLLVEDTINWYRTNVVTDISSDTTENGVRVVIFTTASGSEYKWEKMFGLQENEDE